jgi:hypothetical protein
MLRNCQYAWWARILAPVSCANCLHDRLRPLYLDGVNEAQPCSSKQIHVFDFGAIRSAVKDQHAEVQKYVRQSSLIYGTALLGKQPLNQNDLGAFGHSRAACAQNSHRVVFAVHMDLAHENIPIGTGGHPGNSIPFNRIAPPIKPGSSDSLPRLPDDMWQFENGARIAEFCSRIGMSSEPVPLPTSTIQSN